jgi:hypothetical protein
MRSRARRRSRSPPISEDVSGSGAAAAVDAMSRAAARLSQEIAEPSLRSKLALALAAIGTTGDLTSI